MRRLSNTLKIVAVVVLVQLASALLLPCGAKTNGVVLQPQNELQNQAAQLMIQGNQLLKAKKAFAARPLLEKAAAMWPTSPHGQFSLGLCYSEIGDFQKAIDCYKRAYSLDHRFTEVLPNIGSCYQLMNQPAGAIPWFEEYLRKEPHASDAPQVQGMVAALKRQANQQIDSAPENTDYVASVCPNGKLQRWQRAKLPIRVFISNGCDEQGRRVPGFRDYYNEILVDSFETWSKASGYRLGYTIVEDANNADIVCTWTNRPDFLKEMGTAVEQGAARIASRPMTENEEEIARVRVVILICDVQGKQNISDVTMRKTCLHEIGHALGLAGHSSNNRDIMFFSESPTVWDSLTKRDKATMARLYGDYPVMGPPQQAAVQPMQPTYYQQAPYQTPPYAVPQYSAQRGY